MLGEKTRREKVYIVNHFKYKPEEGQNPYIGFTSFQHFNGEKLYSDSIVRPEIIQQKQSHLNAILFPMM